VFDLSPDKLFVVLVIALMVLGPDRLPDVARTMARARNEIRRITSGLGPETAQALRDPRRTLIDALGQPDKVLSGAQTPPTKPPTPHEPRP
jgi:Sec-independent protein translocase protein TatA